MTSSSSKASGPVAFLDLWWPSEWKKLLAMPRIFLRFDGWPRQRLHLRSSKRSTLMWS